MAKIPLLPDRGHSLRSCHGKGHANPEEKRGISRQHTVFIWLLCRKTMGWGRTSPLPFWRPAYKKEREPTPGEKGEAEENGNIFVKIVKIVKLGMGRRKNMGCSASNSICYKSGHR